MGGIKAVLKSSGIYFAFSIINRLIPFLLLPILTKHIDPSGFGVISVVTTVSSLAMPLVGFCSNSVLFQKYYAFDDAEISGFLKASYRIIFVGLLVSSVAIAAFSSRLADWLGVAGLWLFLGLVCAAFGMVSTLTMSLFQLQGQPTKYGVLQTAGALINFTTAIVLVVLLGLSWPGRVWAMVISSAFLCAIALLVSRRYVLASQAGSNTNHIVVILRQGGALMPNAVSGWVIAMCDRLFLTTMTSLETVGIYAIGVSIAQVTDVMLNSIAQAYLPHVYKHGGKDGDESAYFLVRSIYCVIGLSILVGTGVAVVGPIAISLFIDPKYGEAQMVVPWICLSCVLFSIGTLFQTLLLVEQRNHLTVYISMLAVSTSVLSNIYFIEHFNMVGAAMANAFTGGIVLVANLLLVGVYKPLPWFDKKVFLLVNKL